MQEPNDKTESGNKPDGGTPPNQTPPNFVPTEEFKRMEAQFSERFESQNAKIDSLTAALLQNRPAPTPDKPARKRVTKEELDAAFADNRGSDAMMSVIADLEATYQERTDAQIAKLTREVIEPLRTTGFAAIETVVDEVSRPKMKHYPKFKKDIDDYIAKLPPELRLRADIRIAAHDAVVGRNVESLINEEVEKRLRSGQEGSDIVPGTGSGRSVKTNPGLPTAVELFTADGVAMIEQQGMTPEQYVQKRGHKDWPAYCEFRKKQEEENYVG